MIERTFTIQHRDLDDETPGIPEGATRWEEQELRRLFSNMQRDAEDCIARLVSMHKQAVDGKIGWPTSGWNNAAGDLADAVAAAAGFAALRDAVLHRVHLGEKS